MNVLKIKDMKGWLKLIKDMKFPNVKKANEMSAEQGDEFIKYLEELKDLPF